MTGADAPQEHRPGTPPVRMAHLAELDTAAGDVGTPEPDFALPRFATAAVEIPGIEALLSHDPPRTNGSWYVSCPGRLLVDIGPPMSPPAGPPSGRRGPRRAVSMNPAMRLTPSSPSLQQTPTSDMFQPPVLMGDAVIGSDSRPESSHQRAIDAFERWQLENGK